MKAPQNTLYLFSIVFTFSFVSLFFCSCTQEVSESTQSDPTEEKYDSLMAKSLGADMYGMHQYVMAFLKRGPNRTLDSIKSMELQRAHLDNIHRLSEEGKLVLAGPFLDTGDLRGIYIFDVKTVEEAENLTHTDPAIQAGSLIMELKPWYGSAALMKVGEIHDKISKVNP